MGNRLPEQVSGELVPSERRDSLAAWFSVYLEVTVGVPTTRKAKRSDLQKFLDFLDAQVRSDHPDQWTKSRTQQFIREIVASGNKATTANRALATLKTVAKWIHERRAFLVGDPTVGVKRFRTEDTEWRGLEDINVNRMRGAAEQLIALNTRADQDPKRDRALFAVLRGTGLRVNEVCGLNRSQYQGKHFVDVVCKGDQVRQVFIPLEAREALDDYLEHDSGPLFQNRYGNRISDEAVNAALARICAQANKTLPDEEKFTCTAHQLRHTLGKKIAKSRGIHTAADALGHADIRYTPRYAKDTQAELEDAIEEAY